MVHFINWMKIERVTLNWDPKKAKIVVTMSKFLNNSCLVHTIHKHLFLMRKDACEVGTLQATLPFSSIPCAAMSKVLVALPLEFVPAVVTCLSVWKKTVPRFIKLTYVIQTWLLSPSVDRTPKPISMQCHWSKWFISFGHSDKDIIVK